MPAPRRIYRICLAGILFLVCGCEMLEEITTAPGPARDFLAYTRTIQSDVTLLQQLDSPVAQQPVLFSEDTRKANREATQLFQRTLSIYENLLGDLEKQWDDLRADSLRDHLGKFDDLRNTLQSQALEISLITDSVKNQYESLKLEADLEAGVIDLGSTREYLAACQRLSSSTGSVDDHLSAVHERGVQRATRKDKHAAGVFHFLRLYRLQRVDIDPFARDYEYAWKEWQRAETHAGRPDSAMAILSLVIASTREYRPVSLQVLFEITAVSLETLPAVDAIERMEQSLERIAATLRSEATGPGDWRRSIERARSVLILCRAHVLEPREGVPLASKALEMNSYLSSDVARYLVKAAHGIGRTRIAEQQYADAIAEFRDTLYLGPVPDRESLISRYHSDVLYQALVDSKRRIKNREYELAKEILHQAAQISEPGDEGKKVIDELRSYYQSYINHLFERDLPKALVVCQEALESFPSDERMKRTLDRGLYRLLLDDLGDLDTVRERLGAEKFVELVRGTDRQMVTAEGSASCQRVFRRVEESWSRRLEETRDPSEAFELGVEVARLNHAESPEVSAATAVWRLLDAAVARQDWPQVERCVDLCFSRFPEIQRPESFKTGHLALMEFLDRESDTARLGRHLAIFSRAYPGDADRIRPMVAKHVSDETSVGRGFQALLRTIDGDSPGRSELETPGEVSPPGGDEGEDLAALIDRAELAGSGSWWKEPEQEVGTETGLELAATLREEPLLMYGSVIGGAGSLVSLILLTLKTRRRGWLPYRWYALGAIWVGLSAGFVLGSLFPGGLS